MIRLNTAKNVYNELISNIDKYESLEDYLSENSFTYDAILYYIYNCLKMECYDDEYRYLNNCIKGGLSWEEVYENIHEVE